MEPLWRIALFGGPSLQARGGGEIRRFRSRKVALLLVYLALHLGRDCPREVLCEALWPDDDPEAARNRLRVTLASLRKQLEPPGVPFGAVLDASVTGCVRLSAATAATDLQEFDAALKSGDRATARALCIAPLLPSFYEDWILGERERLEACAESLALVPGSGEPAEKTSPLRGPQASDTPAVRLPVYLTRFFGRETERARLDAWLAEDETRLITLTGPGGNGKTRLSVEAARGARRPAWFVALADLWDGARLAEAIRDALELPRLAGDPLAQVSAFFAGYERPLLVLDNLEQIATRAATTVASLLERSPGLTVLAASRKRLELPGERELALVPLAAPDDGQTDDLARVASSSAVALFLDRAQSVRPDFGLTARNAADIAGICRLLDGIPLGLELAAARAASLTPSRMRARLTEKWDALGAEGKRVQKEDRHRSLRAAIDWSFALLPADQQRLFLQLSVFRGGATLDAVEAVCELPSALESLTRLRASSLIASEERAGELRFGMLETLRQWAAERLSAPEILSLEARHVGFFREEAERAEEPLHGPDEASALDALEAELPNFRAALERADTKSRVRLAGALGPLWERRGYLREGRERLESVLPDASGNPSRFKVLHALGTILARQGDARALDVLHEALSLSHSDPAREASAFGALGVASFGRGDAAGALAFWERCLDLHRQRGDRFGEAAILGNLGAAKREQGRFDDARADFEASVALAREVGHRRSLANALNNLGALCVVLGDSGGATPYFEESLSLKRASGDRLGAAMTLGNLAALACRAGDWERGRALTEENAKTLRECGEARGLATALNRLGQIELNAGNLARAKDCLRESLAIRLRLGNPHDQILSLLALSDLALALGEPTRAARFLGAASARLKNVALPPDEAAEHARHRAAVEAVLSPKAFATAFAEGEALSGESLTPG